jgi:hypothetical protein
VFDQVGQPRHAKSLRLQGSTREQQTPGWCSRWSGVGRAPGNHRPGAILFLPAPKLGHVGNQTKSPPEKFSTVKMTLWTPPRGPAPVGAKFAIIASAALDFASGAASRGVEIPWRAPTRRRAPAGAETIYWEKISGARADRPQLAKLMSALKPGDTVTRLDRLGRSTLELLGLIEQIAKAGAVFRSLGDPLFDTASPQSRLLLAVLAAVASFDTRPHSGTHR